MSNARTILYRLLKQAADQEMTDLDKGPSPSDVLWGSAHGKERAAQSTGVLANKNDHARMPLTGQSHDDGRGIISPVRMPGVTELFGAYSNKFDRDTFTQPPYAEMRGYHVNDNVRPNNKDLTNANVAHMADVAGKGSAPLNTNPQVGKPIPEARFDGTPPDPGFATGIPNVNTYGISGSKGGYRQSFGSSGHSLGDNVDTSAPEPGMLDKANDFYGAHKGAIQAGAGAAAGVGAAALLYHLLKKKSR